MAIGHLQGLHAQAQAFRNALAPLEKEGAIADIDVQVLDDGRAKVRRIIRYRNLGTSRARTITR